MKEKRTVYRRRAETEGRTDWRRIKSLTEKEIQRAARSERDAPPTDAKFWKDARLTMPPGKQPVTVRIDRDVLEWFKASGARYQTRMNAVLRSFMEAHRRAG
jgi:uncharacterized protein (DUF4415 family)